MRNEEFAVQYNMPHGKFFIPHSSFFIILVTFVRHKRVTSRM